MGQTSKKHANTGKQLWKAATQEETNAALLELMQDHGQFLVHTLPGYGSTDMKVGVEVEELIKNPMGVAAARLDPTGMHFKQQDMEPQIRTIVEKEEYLGHIERVVKEKMGAFRCSLDPRGCYQSLCKEYHIPPSGGVLPSQAEIQGKEQPEWRGRWHDTPASASRNL